MGINHFFSLLFSFFPLLWLCDIPHPFPPSLKKTSPPCYSRSRTHASFLLLARGNFFSNFASLKIAAGLPGPSSALYLIMSERKAGWGRLMDRPLPRWRLYPGLDMMWLSKTFMLPPLKFLSWAFSLLLIAKSVRKQKYKQWFCSLDVSFKAKSHSRTLRHLRSFPFLISYCAFLYFQ